MLITGAKGGVRRVTRTLIIPEVELCMEFDYSNIIKTFYAEYHYSRIDVIYDVVDGK